MKVIKYSKNLFLVLVIIIGFGGCNLIDQEKTDPLFKQLSSDKTGVSFSNELSYNEDFSVNDFSYFYNGGGVAVGDINNDGLPDLYFTGNMVSSRLYLNKGNFEFEDITEISGTGTRTWAGGVSMVDINNDGYLDLYISITGPEDSTPEERENLLFINNQDNTFTEAAAEFGLNDTGYTTHTVFFDYNHDGYLDAYLMNNFAGSFSRDHRRGIRDEINDGTSLSADALYLNNGDSTFTNVSENAGIQKEGYSLGIAVNDINQDGWPDIYVSNDVQTDDLLYINNGDGTFTDKADQYFKHTSYAGMGTDIADFNNDGWPDVLQVDMMPPDLEDQQLVSGARDYSYLNELKDKGYQTQYSINTLQMSNGIDKKGNVIFSEIGRLAGVAYTDWSWSALFGDYDNDGHKDIMITNGYPKALNNFDYMRELVGLSMFGTDSARVKREYESMDNLHELKMPNYFFKNNRDLTFSDSSNEWGFITPTFSYGAAHADLDGDGDMDIVINNTNGEASVFENLSDSLVGNNFLAVQLEGDSNNINGIGSKIILTSNGQKQHVYFSPYRGYQSTMDHNIYFGLGSTEVADSLEIIWPDGKYQLLENISANQRITLDYKDAGIRDRVKPTHLKSDQQLFGHDCTTLMINYKHDENEYVDFDNEPLLPEMFSRLGPAIAVGDINNNQLDDIYIGGSAGYPGTLYYQNEDGIFQKSMEKRPWIGDQSYEDTDAEFFDANGDGLLDLYVVSGGNEFTPGSVQLQDRFYLNSGDGRFIKVDEMLPTMYTNGSVVKPFDFDKDGDMDLYIGGRIVPGRYPHPARSYILRNDSGSFTDVTREIAPDLVEPGLTTDAVWIDFNNDDLQDLVTTGIWMPISFYENKDGFFENVTESTGLKDEVGWWYSVEKGDLDGDGNMDLIAGNLGLNYTYSTFKYPSLHIFVNDFGEDQSHDAILAIKKDDLHYPIHGLRSMREQLPNIMRQIRSFQEYAKRSLERLVSAEKLDNALHYEANNFSSSVILNKGNGLFEMKKLPNEVQISSINDIIINDINEDGKLDLIVAGNMYKTNPNTPRNDAGNGLILIGNGNGEFIPVSPFESGFLTSLDVRNLAQINTANGLTIVIGNNNDSLQVFKKCI